MAPNYVEQAVVVNPGKTSRVELTIRPLGAIAGTVENVSTDALLKGVRVDLLDVNGQVLQSSTTGEDGAFRFAGLSTGSYAVRIQLPKGYLTEGDAERVVNIAGGAEARVDFQVYRHGAIEGRVRTEDGRPVAGAEVSLIDSTGTVVRAVTTGADGIFSFLDAPADKYTVRAEVPEAYSA